MSDNESYFVFYYEGEQHVLDVPDWARAKDAAKRILREDGDVTETDHRYGRIELQLGGEMEHHDDYEEVWVSVQPPAPPCEPDEEHEWDTPHELLGGNESCPGVYGHGGGVMYTEVCVKCGTSKHVDTWAQDRATGRQGLLSIRYEERQYEDWAFKRGD